VSNADLPPTIAAMFGVESPKAFCGKSILPVDAYPRAGCYGEAMGKHGKERETDKPVYYYRRGPRRIVHDEASGAWRLFDTDDDPGEKNDLMASASDAAEMRQELRDLITLRRRRAV
jgi:arylsulfatase A-like enzyme